MSDRGDLICALAIASGQSEAVVRVMYPEPVEAHRTRAGTASDGWAVVTGRCTRCRSAQDGKERTEHGIRTTRSNEGATQAMSTQQHPIATHRITWDGDSATFHCDGDQDSQCRNYPACECESWAPGEHEHPDIPQVECLLLPWIEDVPAEETFQRGDELVIPHRDGEIMTEFEDEALWWDYEDEPDDAPQTETLDFAAAEATR